MTEDCYGEVFERYLADILCGAAAAQRERVFRVFLAEGTFACNGCGYEFDVQGEDVEEWHVIRCPRCIGR